MPGDSGEDSGTGKDGWVEKDGKKYYYKNGKPLKGTRKIGGEYYCFDSKDGHLFQNQLLYSASTNRTCYADESGIRVANTWVQTEGKKYIWEQMDMHIKAPEMYMENFIFLTASGDMRLQTENESAVREIFTIMVQMAQE